MHHPVAYQQTPSVPCWYWYILHLPSQLGKIKPSHIPTILPLFQHTAKSRPSDSFEAVMGGREKGERGRISDSETGHSMFAGVWVFRNFFVHSIGSGLNRTVRPLQHTQLIISNLEPSSAGLQMY